MLESKLCSIICMYAYMYIVIPTITPLLLLLNSQTLNILRSPCLLITKCIHRYIGYGFTSRNVSFHYVHMALRGSIAHTLHFNIFLP